MALYQGFVKFWLLEYFHVIVTTRTISLQCMNHAFWIGHYHNIQTQFWMLIPMRSFVFCKPYLTWVPSIIAQNILGRPLLSVNILACSVSGNLMNSLMNQFSFKILGTSWQISQILDLFIPQAMAACLYGILPVTQYNHMSKVSSNGIFLLLELISIGIHGPTFVLNFL